MTYLRFDENSFEVSLVVASACSWSGWLFRSRSWSGWLFRSRSWSGWLLLLAILQEEGLQDPQVESRPRKPLGLCVT